MVRVDASTQCAEGCHGVKMSNVQGDALEEDEQHAGRYFEEG